MGGLINTSINFLFAIINIQQPKSVPAVNKNASVNYDVASGFDVVSKILPKS